MEAGLIHPKYHPVKGTRILGNQCQTSSNALRKLQGIVFEKTKKFASHS